jgi:hypothetical protein
MKRSLLSLLLALALVSLYMPAFADDSTSSSDSMEDVNQAIGALTAKVDALAAKGPSVEIHGFVQADMINDSTQSFSETVGDGAVKQNGSVAGDNGWTQFSERNSRFDFLAKDSVGGWDTKGYLELDLLGYTGGQSGAGYGANPTGTTAADDSEYKFYTQPTVRLRHAYLQADSDGWTILAGQWWSLFGWNMDYVLATVTEAPVMATLYERTPQLRIMKTFGGNKGAQLQLAADAEKPDEISSQVPNLNFGIRFLMNDWEGRFCSSTGAAKLMPFSIGLSERNSTITYDNQGLANTFNQNATMTGSGVAADILLPVLPASEGKDDPSIVLTGEWTAGAGDVDQFNGGGFNGGLTSIVGAAGSGANIDAGIIGFPSATNIQLVQIQSWNGQIQIFLPPSIGTIFTAGYGEIFSPNVSGLGGTWNDDKCMFVNVMQDFTKEIRAGLEFATFDTHYTTAFGGAASNFTDAIDNRVQLSTWYRF